MICPKCETEYPWYVTVCPDCDEDLAERLPGPEPTPEAHLVQVFATDDESFILLAKSMLEAESIEHVIRTGSSKDLFGVSRMGVVGAAEFWVAAEDADRARTLLNDLAATPPPPPPESGEDG